MKRLRSLLIALSIYVVVGVGFPEIANAQYLESVCVFEFQDRPYEWSRSKNGIWLDYINDQGQALGDNLDTDRTSLWFFDSKEFSARHIVSFYQFDGEYNAWVRIWPVTLNDDGVVVGNVFLANHSEEPTTGFRRYSNGFIFSWDLDNRFVDLATVINNIPGRGDIGYSANLNPGTTNIIVEDPPPIGSSSGPQREVELPLPVRQRQLHIPPSMLTAMEAQCGSAPVNTVDDIKDSNSNLEFITGYSIVRYPAPNVTVSASNWWWDGENFDFGRDGELGDDLNFRISVRNQGALDVHTLSTTMVIEDGNDDVFEIVYSEPGPISLEAGEDSEDFHIYTVPNKPGRYRIRFVTTGVDELGNAFESSIGPSTYTIISTEPLLKADLRFADGRSRSVVGLTETFGLELKISATEGENPVENIVLTDPFAGAPNLDIISAPDFPPGGYTIDPDNSRTLTWTLKPNSGGRFRFATTVTGMNADDIEVTDTDSLEGSVTSQDLTVEIALSPDTEQTQNEEIGSDPEPIEFTVDANVCNNTDKTITHVKLNSLDIKPRRGTPIFVERISGPAPIAEMELGSLDMFSCVPIPQTKFVATDDGEIEVDALATAVSSVGAMLTDLDEKYLVIKPKYFVEIKPEVINPPSGELIQAGVTIRIKGTVKNLSNTHKLEVGPLFAELSGNAGAQSFAWNATGSAPDAFVTPEYPMVIEAGGEKEFSIRVATAASDPRHNGTSEGKPTGGTRANINLVPWAVARHPDGEKTPIKPDSTDVYNVPDEVKNKDTDLKLIASIDDSIAIPVTNYAALAAGMTLGSFQAAYDMGVGLLTAPFVLLDGFASLLYATSEYQFRLWESFTEEEKELFVKDVGLLAGTILYRHYEAAKEIDQGQLLEQVNGVVLEQMTNMAEEWELGDYTHVATQYSRYGGQLVGEVAFSAALWKLGKYAKAGQVLERGQNAKNARNAALLRSANVGEDLVDLRLVEQILLNGEAGVEATIDDIVRLFGYTPEEVAALQANLDAFPGTMMTTRSKSARSVFWRQIFDAQLKPEAIKAKGVNWLDELLGYPRINGGYSSVGAMVFKKPDFMVLAEQSGRTWGQEILNVLAGRGINPGDAIYDQAVKRLLLRAEEWKKYEKVYKEASELGYMDLSFDFNFNSVSDNTARMLRSTNLTGPLVGAKKYKGFRLRRISDPDSPFETYVMEMRGRDGRFKVITGDVDNTGFTRVDSTALDERLHAQVLERFYGAGLIEHGDSASAKSPIGGLDFIAKQSEGAGGKQELVLQWKAGEPGPRLVRFNKGKSEWNGPRDFRLKYDGGFVDVGNSLPTQGPRPPLNIPQTPPPSIPAPDRVAQSISAPSYSGDPNVGRCRLFYSDENDASSVIMGSDGRLSNVGPDGTISPSELHDVCFGDGSPVSYGISPSTMLSATMESGTTSLTVLNNGSAAPTTGASTVDGFERGQTIIIGADTEHAEIRQIERLGSLVINQPLEFDHEEGEVVVVVSQQEQPAPELDEDTMDSITRLFSSLTNTDGITGYQEGLLQFYGDGVGFNLTIDAISSHESSTAPGIESNEDGELTIILEENQMLSGAPALLDADLFELALTEFGLVLNESHAGRIVAGQEFNTGSVLYSLLPSIMIEDAPSGRSDGIYMVPSSEVANLMLVSVVSNDSGVPLQQILYPAPSDWESLQAAFMNVPGVERVELGLDGILEITLGQDVHRGIMSYEVNRASGAMGETTVVLGEDVNNDGLPDVLVTYSDGNQQTMYYMGVR